jgi:predicted nucleotide-binding protein (sugar kinase/HSP70/actin superfamily)
VQTVIELLEEFLGAFPVRPKIEGLRVTGSGGRLIAESRGARSENEFKAVACAVSRLYPDVHTVFEIGGQSSKYLRLAENSEAQPATGSNRNTYATGITDCSTSGECAAGTGSFLDQQTPSTEKGYSDFGEASTVYTRGAWRAIVSADILLQLLFKSRPYEVTAGAADALYEKSAEDLCRALEIPYPDDGTQFEQVRQSLVRARDLFRELPIQVESKRPLIGVVGEIFCRLTEFSNNQLVRRLEEAGAEVWMNDIAEWIWYINVDQFRRLKIKGERFSLEALGAHIRNHIQHKDEHSLISLFQDDFRGYEEPDDIRIVLDFAQPYLPASGVNGEMVLNVGKAVYFARKGLDGVIDISPFSCMNGIVSEALYPKVSRDNAGIPIRNFYFDGTQSDLERDLGIFVELAKSYQRQKPWPRQPPRLAGSTASESMVSGARKT